MEKIAEGKTKILCLENSGVVLVRSKPALTARDGKKKDSFEGKDIFATETTCNCFELLKKFKIPVAYLGRVDERTFRAYEAIMMPIEVVVRRIAFGSRLKRHPNEKEGTIFKDPVVEFFHKDDELGDPLMVFDIHNPRWILHNSKKPLGAGFIGILVDLGRAKDKINNPAIVKQMADTAKQVFLLLEQYWEKQNVVLVDLKIEFGFIVVNGETILVVADVVDNDSWRIWPGGDKAQMKDKQVFRDLKRITPRAREKLKENYKWVAEATRKFLT